MSQPTGGGVPRVVADLAAGQVERGWHVTIASPRDEHPVPGARHITWTARRDPAAALPAEVARLRAIVRACDPGLVHLHSAKAGLAGRLLLRGRLPTVFQPHAWSFEAAGGAQRAAALAWERVAARSCDALVCVSEEERSRGQAAGIRGRWAVVPNGVDVQALRPAGPDQRAAARTRLGLGTGPLALLLGRLSEQKGQREAVRLWSRVCARVPRAELALVGDGPLRAELEQLAGPGVRLAGPTAAAATWLAAADVVFAPSRWEAGSLVVLEAMASGRTVVASDADGMRAALGDVGAVVAPADEDGMVEALVRRLADPALAEAEGVAARARAVERFDLRRTQARMDALYAEVLRRRTDRYPSCARGA